MLDHFCVQFAIYVMYKAVILATAAHALQAPQLKRAPRAAAVSAIAPAPVWVAGSILGGAAGTPFVVTLCGNHPTPSTRRAFRSCVCSMAT